MTTSVENIRYTGASVYKSLFIPGSAFAVSATNPAGVTNFITSLDLFAFAGTVTIEQMYTTVPLPRDMKKGGTLRYRVHWTHNNASPTGLYVRWSLDYSVSRPNTDVIPAVTSSDVQQACGAQYLHHATTASELTFANAHPSSFLTCRLYREYSDVGDTLADDAFLIGLEMIYEVGQSGTSEIIEPFAMAGF